MVAAAFTTTSLLALEMSVVAKPHGALLGFSALALWTSVRLVDTGRVRDYCAAGIATGLAMATLNSGLFLFPAFGLAHILGARVDRHPDRRRGVGIALAICAVLCIDSYWLVLVPPEGAGQVDGALNFGEQAIGWGAWVGDGFPGMIPELSQHDPVLFGLAALGLLGALVRVAWSARAGSRRARADAIDAGQTKPRAAANVVVGVFALTWFLLFGLHERFYARYALPIVPIAAVLAATVLRGLAHVTAHVTVPVTARITARITARGTARRTARPHGRPEGTNRGGVRASSVLGTALAALTLAFPFLATFHLAAIRARDDTTEVAARWIVEHLGTESGPIVLDALLTLPLRVRANALAEWPRWTLQPWSRYQIDAGLGTTERGAGREAVWDLRPILQRGMFTDHRVDRTEVLDRLRAVGARWVVVTIPTAEEAANDATRAAVREIAGEPRATILPFGPGGSLDSIFTRDVDPKFLSHLLAKDRLGPPIEVCELP